MFRNPILILIFTFGYLSFIQAQILRDTTSLTAQDTSQYVPQENRYSLFSSFSGKPGRAALYGLVIPGGGQLYNRKYVKAAVLIGAEVWLLSSAINRTNYFKRIDEDWKFMKLNPGLPGPNFNITEISTIENERATSRQNKDYFWLALGGVHLFVIAEAFVNRHLMEFDVSDDLSLRLNPTPITGITLAYSLN